MSVARNDVDREYPVLSQLRNLGNPPKNLNPAAGERTSERRDLGQRLHEQLAAS